MVNPSGPENFFFFLFNLGGFLLLLQSHCLLLNCSGCLHSLGFIIVDHMCLGNFPFLPGFPIDWRVSVMVDPMLTWLDLEPAKRRSSVWASEEISWKG